MDASPSRYPVPLDGWTMQLGRTELEAVAAGLGTFDSSEDGDLLTLVEALGALPATDRAPTWELAVRRFGHHKPLEQAAAEIGLDAIHARHLLQRFMHLLVEVPVPERDLALPATGTPSEPNPSEELEHSTTARVMSAEMLGNAIAHGEQVDLDAAHDDSLRAVDEIRDRS